MTPEQIESRRAWLASLSGDRGELTPDAPHATINDVRYFQRVDGEVVPTPARLRLHDAILRRWRTSQPDVQADRSAILMAGPPGAGKSSTYEHLFSDRDRNHWRELDSDVFKVDLLKAAITDGSLQEMLPEELRMPAGQSYFYPNELSSLVHRESTQLFAVAAREAIGRGDNLIIDGTLASTPWAEELVDRLTVAGYSIQIVDVEAPQDVAAERIVSRWRHGFLEASAEPNNRGTQMGGRWVPRAAVDGLFTELREHDGKPLHGKSVTEVNAREVSEKSSSVTQYDLYRTKAADRGAEHVERRERISGSDLQLTWQALDTGVAPGEASAPNVDSAVLDGLRAASSALPKQLGKVRTSESVDGSPTAGPELDPPGRDMSPEL